MFGDWSWLSQRTREQEQQFDRFLDALGEKRTVVIEMGAGTAIPTIRATSERLGWRRTATTVLRINPREPEIKPPHISPCTALEGLWQIDQQLSA